MIEIMITIAIVALLVAMAVPAYKTYSIRAKVAECIEGAAIAKIQISEYRQAMGAYPPSLDEAGLGASSTTVAGDTQYCDGFQNYLDGSFEIHVNEAAIDGSIAQVAPLLIPNIHPGSGFVNWNCTTGNTAPASVKFLPGVCRDAS